MSAPTEPGARRRRTTAMICGGIALGMVGASFAAVPLYQLFCQVTGYGGTTQRADHGADRMLDRVVTIRFDANIGNGLPWGFSAPSPVVLKIGQTGEAHFRAVNHGAHTVSGQAVFNVTPEQAGVYFNKIACFCFTEQELKPGESIDMPVTFFVDPEIAKDRALDHIETITLSYTFYPLPDKPRPVASSSEAGKKLQ